jgi:hypothetical protein
MSTELITDDEDNIDDREIIRAKWVMDGAATLPEAAEKLRARAAELDELHKQGWRLGSPVEDDYGYLIQPG